MGRPKYGERSACRSSNLHAGAQSPCRRSNLHTGAQSTALSESGTDKEVSSVYETPYDCFAFRGQMVSTKAIVANCSSSRKAMSVHAHGKPRRPEDGRNQMQSDAIRCNHMQSDAIRDGLLFLAHLRMDAIRCNQMQSNAIRRNQRRPPLPRAPEDAEPTSGPSIWPSEKEEAIRGARATEASSAYSPQESIISSMRGA